LLVHIGDPSSNQATTLESQMIHMIQELFGQTLSGTWFVLTLGLGALMWATQVGPKDAVSNLSEWAIK
jgi:hypothetical protein